jgi:hypothetical protein
MMGENLHQKNLFLITETSAHPIHRVDGSLPRQLTIQLGYQLTAIPQKGVSAQASMLLVSSFTVPPGLSCVAIRLMRMRRRLSSELRIENR